MDVSSLTTCRTNMRYSFNFIILLLTTLLISTSCHIGRFFYYNFADTKDYQRFSQVPVKTGDKKTYFAIGHQETDLQDDAFFQQSKTTAFLIVRGDSIIYEYYDPRYNDSTLFTSFSVSKAFISALLGIAIDEGYIKNEDEPIRKYIPELDESLAPVTIKHLLTMRSGIGYKESFINPNKDLPKYYYGTNLMKYVTKLKAEEEPGHEFSYKSANTVLLSIAIERATQMPLNKYLELKLWKPMGMEYDASFNVDSRKNNTIKAFCCFNARARDFAKFGKLYIQNGNWEGQQLISEEWVTKSVKYPLDKDSHNDYYAYNWRVSPGGAFYARGLLGQFIYCDPKSNLVIVRLGDGYGKVNWIDYFETIKRKLEPGSISESKIN